VTIQHSVYEQMMFETEYLGNRQRSKISSKGPPMGNGPSRVEWSRDCWRHVTLKGQGCEPNTLSSSKYLEKGWI